MKDNSGKDFSVGYGKPPLHTRFAKGRSGNRKGRPRGSKNMATLIDEALNERVVIKENGRTSKVTKRLAMSKQLANKAASGDLKTTQFVAAQLKERESAVSTSTETAAGHSAWESVVNETLELAQWESTLRTLIQRGIKLNELGLTAEMLTGQEKKGSHEVVKTCESLEIDRAEDRKDLKR